MGGKNILEGTVIKHGLYPPASSVRPDTPPQAQAPVQTPNSQSPQGQVPQGNQGNQG